VFGVKLIEVIQKVFTWFGKPLLVDAENWMAHPGAPPTSSSTSSAMSANPGQLRDAVRRRALLLYVRRGAARAARGPDIWQITSSGIATTSRRGCWTCWTGLNRWLYSPRSPLNWFTRRRRLEISPHPPVGAARGERLLNRAGIGHVRFNEQGEPVLVQQITAEGVVDFLSEPPPAPADESLPGRPVQR
jgi:hypothetical protein